MKTKYILILALALGVSAWTLNAQDTTNPPQPGNAAPGDSGGPPHGRHPGPAIIKALDANGDGVIDADEITNAAKALKALDKNGDGKLSPDEFVGNLPPKMDGKDAPKPQGEGDDRRGPPRHPPMLIIIEALDVNHDKVIDADEIANAAKALKALDKNGDGKLTPDEFVGNPPPGMGGKDGPRPQDDRRGPPHHPPMLIIEALDANHDGVIDADEIANAAKALKALDKNGDGKLTPDELMGNPPPRHGRDKQDSKDGGSGGQKAASPAP